MVSGVLTLKVNLYPGCSRSVIVCSIRDDSMNKTLSVVQAGSNAEKNWRSKISLDCPFHIKCRQFKKWGNVWGGGGGGFKVNI